MYYDKTVQKVNWFTINLVLNRSSTCWAKSQNAIQCNTTRLIMTSSLNMCSDLVHLLNQFCLFSFLTWCLYSIYSDRVLIALFLNAQWVCVHQLGTCLVNTGEYSTPTESTWILMIRTIYFLLGNKINSVKIVEHWSFIWNQNENLRIFLVKEERQDWLDLN